MKISVVIIAKNESENLKLSLSKLDWCDDIVLVDDFSSDDTKSVAESHGAIVYQRKLDDFGLQKQFAVSKAKHNWILSIDADEILSDNLISEIKQLNLESEITAYNIPRQHVFLGKIFKYGKESKMLIIRLFNKKFGNFNSSSVHEKVETKGKVSNLKNSILHYSYRDLDQYFEKFNVYTSRGAQLLKNKGKNRPFLLIVLLFPIYFLKHYLIYGNFLNGKEGFVWSYLSAWYHTVKYLKLSELNKVSN
ncbi:MAG: glycosyltransferase family 2 protein [Bacteroidia bacterium]